jgi:hypothetical protein
MGSVQLTGQTKAPDKASVWLASAMKGWGLILLSLHLAAYTLPEAVVWGVWPYTFLPVWLGWGAALAVGLLIIPAVNNAVANGVTRLITGAEQLGEKFLPSIQLRFALVALASGGLFWLARLRHLRWGDSYLLSIALSYPDLELRVIYNWQAPFTVFLHQRLWQFVADPLLGWPVETVYATISIICGVLFVYVMLNLAMRLGRNRLEMVVIAGLALSTGTMQLFFGYVENYVIISLLLLSTIFLIWRTTRGDLALVWPVAGLAVTNAFHPSTVFLWPGIFLLGYFSWRRGYSSGLKTALSVVLPPLLVGGAVLLLMEQGGHGLSALLGKDRPGGGDGIWFVPLFETTTEWQQYTMFSTAHILDWANLHLLISPFGLPIFAWGPLCNLGFSCVTVQDRCRAGFWPGFGAYLRDVCSADLDLES